MARADWQAKAAVGSALKTPVAIIVAAEARGNDGVVKSVGEFMPTVVAAARELRRERF